MAAGARVTSGGLIYTAAHLVTLYGRFSAPLGPRLAKHVQTRGRGLLLV